MIYILIGEENFYIKEKINELTKGEKIFISLQEKEALENIIKLLNRRILGPQPTLIIKCFNKGNKNNIKIPDEVLKELSKNDVIFLLEKQNDEFIKKIKNLKLKYEIFTIPKLEFKNEKEFEEFIFEFIRKNKIKIPIDYIKTLAKIFINQPEILIQELKKLYYYKKGELITKEELGYLIRWPYESQIFDLINSLLENKHKEFIMRLKRELMLGTKIENIIGLLNKTLIRILLLKKAKNTKEEDMIGLNYRYKIILKKFANNITEDKIKSLIKSLSQLDRRYKKNLIKEEDFLYELSESLLNNKQII